MAGRCGCSSNNATGASLTPGGCVTVTGAGTTDSPAIIGVKIDPSPSNNLQCGPGGLFGAASQVQERENFGISVEGDGSNATPYLIGVELDDSLDNLLSVGIDGLLATADPFFEQPVGSFLGGAPPAHDLIIRTGYIPVTTALGFGTITFPPFPTGFASMDLTLCSLPVGVVAAEVALEPASATLGSIQVRVVQPDGTAVNGALAFSFIAIGW